MADWASDYNTVTQYWATNWSATSTCYPNLDFTKPACDVTDVAGSSWVKMSIVKGFPGVARQRNLGESKVVREEGFLTIQIFVPRGADLGYANQLAVAARTVWQFKSVGEFRFRATTIREVSSDREEFPRGANKDPESPWYQVNATTPFYRDERF